MTGTTTRGSVVPSDFCWCDMDAIVTIHDDWVVWISKDCTTLLSIKLISDPVSTNVWYSCSRNKRRRQGRKAGIYDTGVLVLAADASRTEHSHS